MTRSRYEDGGGFDDDVDDDDDDDGGGGCVDVWDVGPYVRR